MNNNKGHQFFLERLFPTAIFQQFSVTSSCAEKARNPILRLSAKFARLEKINETFGADSEKLFQQQRQVLKVCVYFLARHAGCKKRRIRIRRPITN